MSKLSLPVNDGDHIQGAKNAPIQLVEYGDYQCPYCGQAYPIVKDIQQKLGDRLEFVFRNFPLSQIHQHALKAAIAAEAAGAQGKFWEMHDMLFENQDALSDDDLIGYAQSLELDISKFRDDFSNREFLKRVEDDFETGVRSGVNGTPTFFINGERYDGSWDEQNLLTYLESL